jgi:PAS domain S-box-containing protein
MSSQKRTYNKNKINWKSRNRENTTNVFKTYDKLGRQVKDRSIGLSEVKGQLEQENSERKQIEKALGGTESRLKYLLESSPAVIYTCKPFGDFPATFISENVQLQLGYTAKDFTTDSKFWVKHIHPEDSARVFAGLANIRRKEHYAHEYRFRRKDGTYRWMHDELRVMRDAKGKPYEMVGYWIDVTDRKQVEEELEKAHNELEIKVKERTAVLSKANKVLEEQIMERKRVEQSLQENERRYKSLFEDSPISLWEEDFSRVKKYMEGLRERGIKDLGKYFEHHTKAVAKCFDLVKVTDVNKATLKFYKVKNKKELQKSLSEIFGEVPLDVFRSEIISLAKGKTRFEIETFNDALKGERKFVSLKLIIVPGYEKTWSKVLVSIIDLTQHKKAEEHLAASEKKYSTLVEKGNDGIIIIQEGLLKFVNQKSSEITGFAIKEAVGRPFISFVSPENRGLVMERYKRRLNGETVPDRYEIEILAKDGRKIPVEVSASLIEHEGKLADMAILRDVTDRKEAEKALRDSEEHYRTLVETSPDAITLTDLGGNIINTNQKAAKLYGFDSIEEILSSRLNAFDFIIPEDRERALENARKTLKTGQIKRIDYTMVRKDGTTFPGNLNVSLIRDEKGKPKAVIGIARDITGRKEAERVLEQEKKKMEVLFRTTNEGLALYDMEGRVVDINPALKKLFGIKRNIIGIKREDISTNRNKYFKNKLDRFDDSLKTQQEVYSGKTVSNVLMKVLSKPPRYLEGNYVPIKRRDGKVVGMSASFRDVTVLKNQAEKIAQHLLEVEKQKNRVQALFENVEESAYIFDKNLKIISANDACEIMVGSTEKELIGKNYYESFGCHDRKGHYYPEFDPVAKVLTSKESVPYDEHLHINKEGKERWVGVSYTPFLNEREDVEQILSIARDITSIKELEKSKSEFVSLASHELRTPLTVINGYLSLLLSGDLGSLDKEQTRSSFLAVLNKVKHETERLTNLVGDLLNVSRIEEGRLKLSFRKVPIVETIDEVLGEFKPMAAIKGVRVKVLRSISKREGILYVMADKDKLKQVFVNLLDNAVKFTESGGEIITEYSVENGQIFIQIKDTGVGIPPNMLPRIFEKFQQAGGSFLKENKGTGLGLFIVKSLVEFHKGKIWVNSKVGKGTTFSFTLPLLAAK